jgi:hypothetical protein
MGVRRLVGYSQTATAGIASVLITRPCVKAPSTSRPLRQRTRTGCLRASRREETFRRLDASDEIADLLRTNPAWRHCE